MASKSSREPQKQQVDNLITCAICLDYFVDPRILACSHTYCLRCIHQTASSNRGQFECPMRDGTRIGKNDIDSLPINRAIRDMVDVLKNAADTNNQNRETSRPQCCECLSAVADFWCCDCTASYCAACCTDAHKGRIHSQHRRVPIHEKPAELKRCGKHRDEKLKYWCSCEELICVDCQLSKQHKDHTPVPIVEVVLDITDKLRAGFKEAQTSLSQTTAQGMLLKSGNDNTNMQLITRTFNALREMINKHEEALKNQVRAIEEKNKMLAENYLALLTNKQKTLSNHNRDFENILSTNDHTQLLEAKRRLTDYLEQLTKDLKELKLPVQTNYRIEGVDQLQANISTILKQARVVEQEPESQQFAAPGTYNQLGCKGRPCAQCRKCRDWYYTGDLESWKWIQNYNNWTNSDNQRWNSGRVWERFKKRDGATCDDDDDDDDFPHLYDDDDYHDCLCDNNVCG